MVKNSKLLGVSYIRKMKLKELKIIQKKIV
jgi:hypothetical protein